MEWIGHMRHSLKKVFVVQGEPQSSEALAQKIRDELAISTEVPTEKESVIL
jgi:predicted metal-dependent RNase